MNRLKSGFRYYTLYGYHFVYFIALGFSVFASKFYAEIGLNNAQIGLMASLPVLLSLVVTPVIGNITDKVSKKRYVLTFMLCVMAGTCFLVDACATNFYALLACITVYALCSSSISSIFTNISLEYTREIGKPYGPIRLCGTLGYQVGELLVGYILATSLRKLYPLMGAGLIGSIILSFMMPDVKGHQHEKQRRMPFYKLFVKKNIRMLYIITFIPSIGNQFYGAFFTKHLGDLGMSNSTVSWIVMLSVVMEIPFLMFADRLAKKTSVWNWLMVCLATCAVRWLGLGLFKTVVPIVLIQQLSVTVMGLCEFIPSIYLNNHLPPELKGTGQSVKSFVSFGISNLIGGMIGGVLAQHLGINQVFVMLSVVTFVALVAFWIPTRRLIREDEADAALNS